MMRLLLLAPLLACLTAGCGQPQCGDSCGSAGGSGGEGGSAGSGGASCDMVKVKLGTGDLSFEPITDGEQIKMVHGNQGGYHVPVSLLARGFDPKAQVYVQFDSYLEDGTHYGHYAYCLTTFDSLDLVQGWRQRTGLTARLGTLDHDPPFNPPTDLTGDQKVRVTMLFRDGIGLDSTGASPCLLLDVPHCEGTAEVSVYPYMP